MCLLCSIMALKTTKTYTSSMVRWEDEQIISLLKIYEKLYITHFNHNNFKVHQWCEIVNMFNKKIDKTWTINNIQSKIDWCKQYHKYEQAKVVKVIGGVPLE